MIYEKLMGNPFVDAGVSAICEWFELAEPAEITVDHLQKMIDEFAPIYNHEKWRTMMFSIFPNSKWTNNAYSKGDRPTLWKADCKKNLDAIGQLGSAGNCIGCGKRDATSFLDRSGVPMTGGKNSGHFSLFTEGVGYCGACAIAIQFSPIAYVRSGGRFLMLHSSVWKALRFWARKCVRDIRQQILKNEIAGCFN